MKVAVIVCETAKGDLVTIAGISADKLMAQARTIRDSGMFEKNKIVSGVGLCSWKPMPFVKFRCETDAQKKAKEDQAKADAEAAKIKAKADAKAEKPQGK